MGTTFWHKAEGVKAKDEVIRDLSRTDGTSPVVDIAMVGSIGYMAYEMQDGTIVGMVAITHSNKRDYYNFGVKYVDEFMGPTESNCPARILDKLTPLVDNDTSSYALEWRERCRQNLAKKKNATKLEEGDIVTFAVPMSFGRYGTHQTFTYSYNRGHTFTTSGGLRCRVTKWQERTFTVKKPAVCTAEEVGAQRCECQDCVGAEMESQRQERRAELGMSYFNSGFDAADALTLAGNEMAGRY